MNAEKKAYVTTEAAGTVVAGQRVPLDYEATPPRPKVGHELQLTPDEAQYELAQGTIEPAPAPKAKKPTPATGGGA